MKATKQRPEPRAKTAWSSQKLVVGIVSQKPPIHPTMVLATKKARPRHGFWTVVESEREFEVGGDHAGRIAVAAR